MGQGAGDPAALESYKEPGAGEHHPFDLGARRGLTRWHLEDSELQDRAEA